MNLKSKRRRNLISHREKTGWGDSAAASQEQESPEEWRKMLIFIIWQDFERAIYVQKEIDLRKILHPEFVEEDQSKIAARNIHGIR